MLRSLVLITTLSLTACLSGGDVAPNGCTSDEECPDPALCDRALGLCVADEPPAALTYSGIYIPADMDQQPMTELPQLFGPGNEGQFVALGGKLGLDCAGNYPTCIDEASIDARLEFERQSLFTGGPTYRRVVRSTDNNPAYDLMLQLGNSPASLAVLPDGDFTATVPPKRISINGNIADIVLGTPAEVQEVTFTMTPPPQTHTDVSVWIRDNGRRISTITNPGSDGSVSLRREFVAYGNATEIVTQDASLSTQGNDVLLQTITPITLNNQTATYSYGSMPIPSKPQIATMIVPVSTFDNSGKEIAVGGAEVTLHATLTKSTSSTVHFTSRGYTDTDGNASLAVLADSSAVEYTLTVVPSLDSKHQAIAGEPLVLDAVENGRAIDKVRLASRVLVTGRLITTAGAPIVGATVRAQWNLENARAISSAALAARERIVLPTATTDGQGNFVMFVDAELAGERVVYDLEVSPTTLSTGSWIGYIDPAASIAGQLSLTDHSVPASYYVPVPFAPDGDGGELRVYQVANQDVCSLDSDPPCVVPATLIDIAPVSPGEAPLVRVSVEQLR